jgi:hypothetical protein
MPNKKSNMLLVIISNAFMYLGLVSISELIAASDLADAIYAGIWIIVGFGIGLPLFIWFVRRTGFSCHSISHPKTLDTASSNSLSVGLAYLLVTLISAWPISSATVAMSMPLATSSRP